MMTPDETTVQMRRIFSVTEMDEEMFKIGATLGTGTFGRVRLVTYKKENGELVYLALKILKKSEIIRLKQVEHIKQEKNILSRICHPFIVNLFAAFQTKDNLCMLMEYVIGGELFSQLRRVGRFNNETAQFYTAEIVLAFSYLHDLVSLVCV